MKRSKAAETEERYYSRDAVWQDTMLVWDLYDCVYSQTFGYWDSTSILVRFTFEILGFQQIKKVFLISSAVSCATLLFHLFNLNLAKHCKNTSQGWTILHDMQWYNQQSCNITEYAADKDYR